MLQSIVLVLALSADPTVRSEARYSAELIFPLHNKHNHAPGIVECPGGDLLVSWYRGSGERTADDVAVYGSRLKKGAAKWDEPYLLADTPGFPDCNTALFIDRAQRLWLFYPTILANTWESCLTNFKIASRYDTPGAPRWDREGIIFLKPDDFAAEGRRLLDERLAEAGGELSEDRKARLESLKQ